MYEIARVTLENEMDLILAHKRSMKLAELAGLSLSSQTTFATAVSEVARNIIEHGKSGYLVLNVDSENREKYIVASLMDEHKSGTRRAGLEYAKRLVNKYNISTKGAVTSIELFYYISPSFRIDIHKIDEWKTLFRNEPPISPYEELKRKNEQLQELSGKIQKSETQYKTLTNSLPLIIFSLDTNGQLHYANEWLTKYSGETVESLNKNKWNKFVHPDDYNSFTFLLQNDITKEATTIKLQARLRNKFLGEFLWHQISLTPFKDDAGQLQYWTGYIVDIHAQKIFEETLKDNIELKQTQEQLREFQKSQEHYIEDLNHSNLELQQFAFVASHDLQEPVRKILFYCDYLVSQYTEKLDGRGKDFLINMQSSAQRMRVLIKDLLIFSQIKKEQIVFKPVDLNKIANHVYQDFEITIKEKKAEFNFENLPVINSDERMMSQLFGNLVSNSLKFSREGLPPKINISCVQRNGVVELAFEDNGIGFDEKYLPQMFTLFQRLHNRAEYVGTGLGLAICKKIVDIHSGKIWAHAKEDRGATFYISLPTNPDIN